MTSLKTSIKTITYLSDIGYLEIQGASLEDFEEFEEHPQDVMEQYQDYPYDYDY